MEFQEDRLEDDFQKMADVLMRSSSATFMYRDLDVYKRQVKNLYEFVRNPLPKAWQPVPR